MPTAADGSYYPLQASPGMGLSSQMVSPSNLSFNSGTDPSMAILDPITTQPNSASTSVQMPSANYTMYIIGIVVLLIVMKFASEHEKSKMDPKIVGIGVWNFMSVGILATLFLVGMKVIMAKYPIPGIAQIIGAA